jgi:flagellar biosynthesis/type III secretory pathway ATPase
MVKYEIKAYSLDEAKQKAADMGLTVVRNVTQSWKNAGAPVADKEFKTFAVDMMDKNRLTNSIGVALVVAFIPGSKDTRERPYKLVNNVQEGRRTTKRVFEVRIKETEELVGEAFTKGEAIELAKAAMVKYKKDMRLEPMNPYERRIIHSALQGYPNVMTKSVGSEPNRKVIICYVK